ncbi:MAG: hypothetical protein EOM08_03485 [Clostridia bacterium]|nr:hypothetical protein [Clostridia bacterium]NCC75480.1 hypothetical protein [Clostridia bacterium]
MKKHESKILPHELSHPKSRSKSRRKIHWLVRLLVALVFASLSALSLLAYWSTFNIVTVTLPTRVYQARRQAAIDYQVVSVAPETAGESFAGEGQVYVSALAQSVRPVFHYTFAADSSQSVTISSQILATLRIWATKGQDQLLFEDSQILAAPEVMTLNAAEYQIERAADIPLQNFKSQFQAFASQTPLEVRGELVIGLVAKTEALLPSGLTTLIDQPSLVLPLTNDTFSITKNMDLRPEAVWRLLPYQVVLEIFHAAVFPAAAVIFLIGLVLWLRLTQRRRKDPFEKKLAWMKRQCRGRLMMISDKAWEPEWCITTQDFKTMVRTARKLKHPVFCHVDRQGPFPVAYFYVYYGENNYCLTFRPEGSSEAPVEDDFELPENRQLPSIPTLPEMPQTDEDQTGEHPPEQD